jgi:hypothetical protein
MLRDRRFIIERRTRRAASNEREKPQAGERFKQRGRRKQRGLHTLHSQHHRWGEEKKG